MNLSQKIATFISIIVAVVWVILKMIPNLVPIDLSYPAIALFTLCEAVVCWNNKRKWSYLLIAGAAVSMACFILEMTL